MEGVPPSHAQKALTKIGKSTAEVEKLVEIASLFRLVTVEAFQHDPSSELRMGFDRPQEAFTHEEIRAVALSMNRDVRNEIDWVNTILFPGGLGDNLAIQLLVTKVLHIPNFALVKHVVDGKDRVLRTTDINSSSPLDGKNMVLYNHGHYEAIAPGQVSAF